MQKKFIETILIQHSWKSSKEAQTLNFQRLSPLLCSSTVKLEIIAQTLRKNQGVQRQILVYEF